MEGTKKLRFAILARVSTERQGDKGESLRTQEKNLRQAVKQLGGTIPKDCEYIGQEHTSSEGTERKILNKLLRDAELHKFDAVMVDDTTRLGRNKRDVDNATDILKENNILLFDKTKNINLCNPEDLFSYDILTSAAQYLANSSAKKSIANRIERAKRGWVTAGKPPFGRRVINLEEKSNGGNAKWEIIPEDKNVIEKLYKLYVEKKLSFKEVANKVGGKSETIRKRLMFQSGDTFTQTFKSKRFGINQTGITNKIPPLLTKQQINNVKERASINRVYRKSKNVYPLAHRVRCLGCGSVLSGHFAINNYGTEYRYYRHFKAPTKKGCVSNIPAGELEKNVFGQLGQILSNQKDLERAIKKCIVNTDEQKEELQQELKDVLTKYNKLSAEQDKLIVNLSLMNLKDGTDTTKRIKNKIEQNDQTLQDLEVERDNLKTQLDQLVINIPKDLAKKVNAILFTLTGLGGSAPTAWTPKDKQKLVDFFFGRGDKKLGVFVKKERDKELGEYISYEVHGMLGDATGVISDYVYLHDKHTGEITKTKLNGADLAQLVDSISDDLPIVKAKAKKTRKRKNAPRSKSLAVCSATRKSVLWN